MKPRRGPGTGVPLKRRFCAENDSRGPSATRQAVAAVTVGRRAAAAIFAASLSAGGVT